MNVIGTWRLVRAVSRDGSGNELPAPYGGHPAGRVMLGADGSRLPCVLSSDATCTRYGHRGITRSDADLGPPVAVEVARTGDLARKVLVSPIDGDCDAGGAACDGVTCDADEGAADEGADACVPDDSAREAITEAASPAAALLSARDASFDRNA